MAYTKYSLTPANNNAAPPDGAPEGMLPSAVNDTMRDMMAQIRDVGDGIRGGTYTMTAPVITGGSITGVALSGNTFTNPVITGGSINNTPIGASTANTGAFTTLGASGVATFSAGTVSAPAITTTGDTNTGIFFPAADTIAFTEGGVESMRITSAGNLGIGTTSAAQKLQIGSSSADDYIQIGATGLGYVFGRENATGEFLFNATQASPYNVFKWQQGGTERMRIDSSGNVGIGTSSPIAKLDITNGQLALTEVYGLRWYGSGSTLRGSISADSGSNLYFGTGSSNTERMRIDSSGNVLVGTTSSNGRLSVQGVDSTGSNYALNTRNSGNNQLLAIRNDGYANFGTQATAPYNFGVSSATKAMFMDSSGGLGFNSSVRASKTNIKSAPSVAWVNNLDIVTFNYRKRDELGNYTEEAEKELRWGVIAEDAEKVAKELCSYDSNGNLDGFNYDRLVPVLVKAIQEQQAMINELKAKVAALEAK